MAAERTPDEMSGTPDDWDSADPPTKPDKI